MGGQRRGILGNSSSVRDLQPGLLWEGQAQGKSLPQVFLSSSSLDSMPCRARLGGHCEGPRREAAGSCVRGEDVGSRLGRKALLQELRNCTMVGVQSPGVCREVNRSPCTAKSSQLLQERHRIRACSSPGCCCKVERSGLDSVCLRQ